MLFTLLTHHSGLAIVVCINGYTVAQHLRCQPTRMYLVLENWLVSKFRSYGRVM